MLTFYEKLVIGDAAALLVSRLESLCEIVKAFAGPRAKKCLEAKSAYGLADQIPGELDALLRELMG